MTRPCRMIGLWLLLLAPLVCAGDANTLWAQEAATPAFQGGRPDFQNMTEEQRAEFRERMRGMRGGRRPDQEQNQPAAQPEAEKTDEAEAAKPEGEAQPAEETVTKRPETPKTPPNPAELDVRPADDGLVSFSFKGQPWPSVLDWLADISNMSLEWQEAPPGYLDLTTRRRYTVAEVRDLLNSILLSRGYTLLRNEEIMMVVKLEGLDSSLVPRISAEELDERGKFELVKTFFDLERLRADTVAEELKPLLSSYGKISALKTTNRLDVLETAGNLRRIRDVLADEQSASGQNFEMREYPLRHVRAEEVLVTLNTLLGLEPKGPAMPLTQEQMQAQQQAMMMMQQRRGGNGNQNQGQPQLPTEEPEIRLAVNSRENSILANAAPDKLAVIEQAIKYLDVPTETSASALARLPRVQVYRLTGVDPTALVKVLRDVGNLDRSTRLEVDQANRAIIANAPMIDHLTIRTLVEKIDGTGRKFEVIQLRRLSAEYVAGSIEFLMRGAEEDNNSRSRSRYSYYDYYSRSSRGQDDESDKFQVEADTENNRLLLRANDVELEEIRHLLVKLGEDPYEDGRQERMRVIRVAPGDETEQLLERLRRLWPTVGPNPLEVEPARPTEETPTRREREDAQDAAAEPTMAAGRAGTDAAARFLLALHQAETSDVQDAIDDAAADINATDDDASDEEMIERPALPRFAAPEDREPGANESEAFFGEQFPGDRPEGPPPVVITRGPEGLIITSEDPRALQAVLDLANQIAPRRSSYKVFSLRHTYAKDIAYLLEDIFEDEETSDTGWSPFFFGWGNDSSDTNSRSRLSDRRPLKFIPDPVTNTVLVQNADDAQMAEVEEIIKIYDRIEPPDSQSVRHTEMVSLRYAEAPTVLEVIKDVYRDLLSPNDKALTSNQPQQQREDRSRMSFFGISGGSDDQELPRFRGLISIGVNPRTNTLVVSAPQFLLTDVVGMIHELDEAAEPTRPVVQVMKVGRFINDPKIKEVLSNIANPEAKTTSTPAAAQAAERSERERGDNGDRGDRGDRGRGRRGGSQAFSVD